MSTQTDLSKKQLALILSALDDTPRSPANKGEALRAIGRSAARIGLTAEDVLAGAPGLLDERLTPAEVRAELQDLAAGSDSAAAEPPAAVADEAATEPQDGEELPPAAEAPEVAEPPSAAGTATAAATEAQPAGDPAYYDDYPTRGTAADQGAWAARRDDAAREAEAAAKPTPRAGTKQALMIELLKRPGGATVEQIAAATGWQQNSPSPSPGAGCRCNP